jgi:hypothetical protein
MNTSTNSLNEQLIDKKLAIPDTTYMEYLRIANEAMNDVNGYKTQRVRQYIESQRNYTQPQTTSSLFIERNPVDVRFEQPQKQPTTNPMTSAANVEPLPLPDNEGVHIRETQLHLTLLLLIRRKSSILSACY